MSKLDRYSNKVWCLCGKQYYVSKFQPRTFEEALLYSQGYNEGLKRTYEKIKELMYDWNLDLEQRLLIEGELHDLATLDMPTTSPECRCPEEDNNG
jgi:hypothetical protein